MCIYYIIKILIMYIKYIMFYIIVKPYSYIIYLFHNWEFLVFVRLIIILFYINRINLDKYDNFIYNKRHLIVFFWALLFNILCALIINEYWDYIDSFPTKYNRDEYGRFFIEDINLSMWERLKWLFSKSNCFAFTIFILLIRKVFLYIIETIRYIQNNFSTVIKKVESMFFKKK